VVLVKALAQSGDLDVHVITLERGRARLVVERDGNVTIHRLPRSHWPEIADIFVGPSRKRLLHYVQELRPDILHTHETFGLTLGNSTIPHLFTVHGFDHANLRADCARLAWIRSLLWKLAERRGLSKQKHIVSITPYVKAMIASQTSATIYDIDNPVDQRYFSITRQPEPERILCVGWISERKNTLGSVEAFARIADRFAGARLVIAGEAREPEYLDQVQQAIRRHCIGGRVTMLGHINHAELMGELAQASVFLLPSRQENAPMAIAEAMAAGVPVVASNRCGMPYMIEESRTGFLVDPESTEQIADRLARLLDSKELCHRMGEAAKQVAMERFHPEAVAEKTMAVYRKVCGK